MAMLNQTAQATSQASAIFVYGYGPAKNPFYEEARAKKHSSDRWSLLLTAPVSTGQKLILIDGAAPVEGQIVAMRSINAQIFEVEVSLTRQIQ